VTLFGLFLIRGPETLGGESFEDEDGGEGFEDEDDREEER